MSQPKATLGFFIGPVLLLKRRVLLLGFFQCGLEECDGRLTVFILGPPIDLWYGVGRNWVRDQAMKVFAYAIRLCAKFLLGWFLVAGVGDHVGFGCREYGQHGFAFRHATAAGLSRAGIRDGDLQALTCCFDFAAASTVVTCQAGGWVFAVGDVGVCR